MNIYDVQNTQYALSVLDEIQPKKDNEYIEQRVPVFKFENDFITGNFFAETAQMGAYSDYSLLKNGTKQTDIETISFSENEPEYQIQEVRHFIFSELRQDSFTNAYELPDDNMEMTFIKSIIEKVNNDLKPQNNILIGNNIHFKKSNLDFDSYQFSENDSFELVSIELK
ncbi:hypothetical protein LIX87_08710 [Weissella viridescens]|uniref:hypothetical protein n=1 Tax=Weissella viridescens TaxID=1629 RepID=UPI001D08A3AE|nr:hypothetical protein [Weissella viridescens]MCB6841053.1 hypothetical protein [Weissella viridescens]MCB6847786.1 hypothetical protein [Weissella viridescens]